MAKNSVKRPILTPLQQKMARVIAATVDGPLAHERLWVWELAVKDFEAALKKERLKIC